MKNWIRPYVAGGNIYIALCAHLLLILILFMVCRWVFYLFNIDFFPGMTLSRFMRISAGGVRFDLTAVLYLNALFVLLMIVPLKTRFKGWYQRALKYLFVLTNTLGLAVNVADTIYYRYTLKRTTLSVMQQFRNEQNFVSLFFQFFMDYWYAVLFLIALVYLMIIAVNRIKVAGPVVQKPVLFYSSGIVGMLIISGLVVAGIRGGFGESTRPITLSNAAQYATMPKDINLVLNTPFALLRTARTPVIEKVNYFESDASAEAIFSPVHQPRDSSAFSPKNVVIIILESFSREFFGIYNPNTRGYTPFLDSLIGHSQVFQYAFANGRKSIDAMPSVICSIPAIEVPFVLSHYSGNRVSSLSRLLKEKGYYTAFFHGAPNGSMGFQAFANTCDFDDYFGKDEYGNNQDYDGIWGIWDHKFLDFYAEKMNTFQQPFYTNFFSVSSHHPYNLPEDYENVFKGGDLTIYRCIEYTDQALRTFFRKASKMLWYENTIFVITADHASAQIHQTEYNTSWGYFAIPIFFFEPGSGPQEMKHSIMQQIDIMPSILGKLHYDKPYIAFGRDVFDLTTKPVAFNFLDDTYQSFSDRFLLQFDGTKSVALYDFRNDRYLTTNLIQQLPDTVNVMEKQLKAFIQQYKNRMVDDHLTTAGSQSPK